MVYHRLIKPLLFLWPAEKAHHLSTTLFSWINALPVAGTISRRLFHFEDARLEKTIFGIRFPNPVGLAAGFDKDGKYFRTMSQLGFGFIEIGTVTPRPQSGNPQPRLFRLPRDKALINRMGFNNEGVDAMVERLKRKRPERVIIGGNIGKNKDTPNDKAISDYDICFQKLYPHVDYFTLNVSSPNTPGLRSLQDKEPLGKLLRHIAQTRSQMQEYKPVLLKIAPDLNLAQIDDVLELVEQCHIDGIITGNTTISREGLTTDQETIDEMGDGGLSGAPLHDRALTIIRYIRNKKPEIPIIGVGGICLPDDAIEMINAGADLVQVYTGLIYEGPAFVKRIKKKLVEAV